MKLINVWKKVIESKISKDKLFEEIKKNYPPLTSVAFTRECNLNCKHCIYPKTTAEDIKLNNLSRIDKIIEATFTAGSRDLIHIGRMLKKEHLPILKKYQDKGMIIHLIDNGSAKRLITQIKEIGLYFSGGIDISIDGNQLSHDMQRGPGSWELALKGIEALKDVSRHISVTGTASSLNFDTIVDGLVSVKQKFPKLKITQITTTSPANFHEKKMDLNAEEMRIIFQKLLLQTKPPRLLLYRDKDFAAILPDLMKHGKPKMKHVHMEWKIGNLQVAYFPESIVISEEFGIDSNGHHIPPFGTKFHLSNRPEEWEMRDDIILNDPDGSYTKLVNKYLAIHGNKKLEEEIEMFKQFNNNL